MTRKDFYSNLKMKLLFWWYLVFPLVTSAVYLEIVPNTASAVVGSNVTLNCMFQQSYDPKSNWILWEFSTDTKRLTVWKSFPATDKLRDQDEHFKDRAEVEFKQEKTSLTLQNISVSDTGKYRCIIGNGVKSKHLPSQFVTLSVSAPYQIQVNIHYQNDITVLQCVAEGGFPLGELEWHFQNGEPINQNQTVLNSDNIDGTFVISNTLKLEWVVSASVCCSIRHPILKTEKSYCKDIKENCEGNPLSNDTIYYVTTIIFLLLLLIIACLVYIPLIQRRKREMSGAFQHSKDQKINYTAISAINSKCDYSYQPNDAVSRASGLLTSQYLKEDSELGEGHGLLTSQYLKEDSELGEGHGLQNSQYLEEDSELGEGHGHETDEGYDKSLKDGRTC